MKHLVNALDGQNQWWKYLIIVIGGFFAANIIGAIPLGIVMVTAKMRMGSDFVASDDPFDLSPYGIDSTPAMILLLIPFAVGFFFSIFLIKQLHKRSFAFTVNGLNRIRWNRFFYGVFVWGALLGVSLIISYLVNPDNYIIRFDLNKLLPLLVVALILIPLQTSYEEVVFRGYLMQGIGAWTKSKWAAIIITSVSFGLLHSANPEVKEFGFWITMPSYIAMGFMLAIVTILDDGIELALGIHAINNILASILITFDSSAFQTDALLKVKEINPAYNLVETIVLGAILIILLQKKYNWSFNVLNKPIVKPISIEASNETLY